jgi:hypothetical protein
MPNTLEQHTLPDTLPVVKEVSRNVHVIEHKFKSTTEDFWILLTSDRHHDNPHCNQDLEKFHLEQAKQRNAAIIDYGDLFCAMQGAWDRRKSKSDIRPENNKSNYLDSLVSTAADFYGPYAQNFAVIGPGNHETAITKHHETNLTERLVERLNTQNGSDVRLGGYTGWVMFKFWYGGADDPERRCEGRVNLWYNHGYGGGAPVTKGTIQTARQAVYVPDAHIVCSGHTHDEWIFPIQRMRIKQSGLIHHDEQLHIKTPGYKEEFVDGYSGWHIERGAPPKPNGACWLRFWWSKSSKNDQRGIRYEAIRAKYR